MLKFDYEYYLQLPSNCLVVYILMRWYVSTRHACMNKKEIWMSRYNTIKKNQQQYNGADEEKRKKNAEWTHASFEWMVIMTTILMASHKLLFVIFLYLSAVFFSLLLFFSSLFFLLAVCIAMTGMVLIMATIRYFYQFILFDYIPGWMECPLQLRPFRIFKLPQECVVCTHRLMSACGMPLWHSMRFWWWYYDWGDARQLGIFFSQ